jgi:hypothetical protein
MGTQIVTASPGQNITILVRAVQTDANGNFQYSDYASYPFTVPTTAPDGGNFESSNSSTNIELSGGSTYAGSFPDISTGTFDPATGTTTGSGVILNKNGLAGYASGTKEFYIDSRTGNATFAGSISGASITIPATSPKFSVTTAGLVTATSGAIGGWNISSNQIYSTSSTVLLDNSGFLSLTKGGKTIALTTQNTYPQIYIGSGSSYLTSDFYVDGQGYFGVGGGNLSLLPASQSTDGFAHLNVNGIISGAIQNNTLIPLNKLSVSVTSITVNSSTNVTFTTPTNQFLNNEYVFVSGITTTGLTSLNTALYITNVSTNSGTSTTTFTVDLTNQGTQGTSGITVSASVGTYTVTGVTAQLREVTLGLHPAENVGTNYYHNAGTGLRLDPYNWWFTNSNTNFRVGNQQLGMLFTNGALTLSSTATSYTLGMALGGTPTQNYFSIYQNSTSPSYNSSTTPFYVDATGSFSLGNSLTWNGSTLSVSGNITANAVTAGISITSPIISYGKVSFTDSTSGYYIGGGSGGYGINIGSSTKYLQYTSSTGNLNIVGGSITGSSFTSTNYGTGSGWSITSSSGIDTINANVSGANVGSIQVVSGGMIINGGSNSITMTSSGAFQIYSPNSSLLFVNAGPIVTVTTADLGGGNGVLRNIWASPLASNPSPSGGASGDIWIGW